MSFILFLLHGDFINFYLAFIYKLVDSCFVQVTEEEVVELGNYHEGNEVCYDINEGICADNEEYRNNLNVDYEAHLQKSQDERPDPAIKFP